MASNTINQGAISDIIVQPVWGTLDKQEEEDSVDRFIAIVDSIKKLLDAKANIDHNHDDRYYTESEIDEKLAEIDIPVTPMYGYCETAAETAAKTVTIQDFTLVTGRTIFVKFKYANTASNPTLNVNSTGALPIYRWGTTAAGTTAATNGWQANSVIALTYDGTGWLEHLWQNNTYNLANNYLGTGNFVADSVIYRYKILVSLDRDTLSPLNNANNVTGTTKTILTDVEFDPFSQIYYYDSTTTVNENALISGGSVAYSFNNIDLRHTFNIDNTHDPLVFNKDVYMKVIPLQNGKVKLASAMPLVQELPTTNDGYWYIFLGRAATRSYGLSLYPEKPVFYHDDDGIRQKFDPYLQQELDRGSGGSDTISFHGSDMIVEPGTNRITFDDSDMIIHPPDGAAWLERTMEAIEGGIAIISTNNEHAAINNGQYVYIRMHETLPDGLYKATDDIAQDAALSDLNVESASGALNDKSDVGHDHDDRYYTESETDTALDGKLDLSGGTMTGQIMLASSGYKTNSVVGYSADNMGNFKHLRDTTTDFWHLDSYDGTANFSVYWETGEIRTNKPLGIAYGGTGATSASGMVSNFFAFDITNVSATIGANAASSFSGPTISKSGYKPLYFSIYPGDYCDWVLWHCQSAAISGNNVVIGTYYAKSFQSNSCTFNLRVAVLWVKA